MNHSHTETTAIFQKEMFRTSREKNPTTYQKVLTTDLMSL